MRAAWNSYSAAEKAWLEANRTLPIGDYHAGFCATFARADISAEQLRSLRKRKGWLTGRSGRFDPGNVSWNKGKPGAGGCMHPNSIATRFKKGGPRTGFAAALYQPIGTERTSKDGYLERKINDGMPLQKRWRAVHLLRWEAINGPLPKAHALKCLNSDRLDTDPSNWELVHRGVLARLNGGHHRKTIAYDAAPAELKPTVMAVAKLKHQVHVARRGSGS